MAELKLDALFRDFESAKKSHPAAEPRDYVKFFFQGIMGMGHLLGDERQVLTSVDEEMRTMAAEPDDPLITPVGARYMRLNLRPARAAGFTAETVARLMCCSEASPFTRDDVIRACRVYTEDHFPLRIVFEVRDHADSLYIKGFLPYHSEAYRAAYAPAYRIISRAYEDMLPAILAIQQVLSAGNGPYLVTLDGPCASGKTTMAKRLGELFGAMVLHTDEYVVPHAKKTADRLAIPGGNCDWERLTEQVLIPWKASSPCWVQPYDCHADEFMPGTEVTPTGLMILEGSYSNLPAIRNLADLRLFADTPWETRIERLKKRESAASLEQFYSRWIPLEDAYFKAYGLPDDGCLRIVPSHPDL